MFKLTFGPGMAWMLWRQLLKNWKRPVDMLTLYLWKALIVKAMKFTSLS